MNIKHLAHIIPAMEETVRSGTLPGSSTLVFYQGEEVFFHACGSMDGEAKHPIQRDTIFRLFSMTKPVAAAAAMALVQRGQLDLFAPVSHYLEGFRNQRVAAAEGLVPVRREATIKDLMNMTSGLVYPGEGSAAEQAMASLFYEVKQNTESGYPASTVDFANRIGRQPLAFHPGESWQYGTSADVLGAVIEVVAGVPFGTFLQRDIFGPLGMHDTGFYVPAPKADRFSKLFWEKDGKLEIFRDNHLGLNDFLTPPVFESGGAGLVSTLDDSLHFCRMLLGQGELEGVRVLSPAAVDYMTHNQLTGMQRQGFTWDSMAGFGYSCFMRVMENPSQSPTMGSTGEYGWDGWTGAYMTVDPAHELILLFMLQKTDSGTTELTRKIRNIVYASL